MQKVTVIHTSKELQQFRQKLNQESLSLGFVPTMGALHAGHVSLIEQSCQENDFTLVSIFVNPRQFNSSEDLEKYPRDLDADVQLLNGLKNCVVFAPTYLDLYPENDGFIPMDLGQIGRILEGAFRPGHLEGVVHVVHNLFHLIHANRAYFGQKDFQQLVVVRLLTKHYGFNTLIIACPTVRETSGLAMSSRNKHLSQHEREDARNIIEVLRKMKSQKNQMPLKTALKEAKNLFSKGNLKLEYLVLVDPETLCELSEWQESQICCLAAYCGSVRLIDNLLF